MTDLDSFRTAKKDAHDALQGIATAIDVVRTLIDKPPLKAVVDAVGCKSQGRNHRYQRCLPSRSI